MAAWDSNYVTDIPYMPGYYLQQSPAHLVAAARLVGVACDMPEPDESVHVLELGCGFGLFALTLAASNPAWRVTAIDFHPGHIKTARAFARQTGIANVNFLEADLATLVDERAADAIPEADFVSLHGVWSWVSAEVRAGIVRLLKAKVRAGGVVHLSYNALPAWQAGLGMQRLVRTIGLTHQGQSTQRAEAGFTFLHELHSAGARHLTGNPLVEGMLQRVAGLSREYLAHEFMNGCWSPCFHADVAEALSAAKLEWIGSANLFENFPELTLTAAQRKIFAGVNDPMIRELVKDLCLARMLRHDVFVRGVRRLTEADRAVSLRELTLASVVAPEDFQYQFEVGTGMAELSRDAYEPLVMAMAEGPQSLGELLKLPTVATKLDNPGQVAGFLVGTGQAMPTVRPEGLPDGSAIMFNRQLAKLFGRTDQPRTNVALASPVLGAGVPAGALDLYVWRKIEAGDGDAGLDDWTAELGVGLDVEGRAELRTQLEKTLTRRVPIFRKIGTLPP